MATNFPNIKPGEIVPGGFTFSNNAQVVGDELYIRDANGNQIPDRSVSNGDNITVLDVGYSKQLVLVQYPAGSYVRQGYVTNATNLINYFHQGEWHNGSTSETVYDENDKSIGSIDPYEAATPLYKDNGKTCVVYTTSKGENTKSGFVAYEGSIVTSDITSGIKPGEIVPGGFTYENNAQVVGDELYLRDANGNQISNRSVSDGDNITVLDVGYTKQLVLVQYPSGNDVRQGYVSNATKLIKYYHQGQWHNGSTSETVYDGDTRVIGSLDPYESATPIYKKNGMTHVVYTTSKGENTKSGFVVYEGSSTAADVSQGIQPGEIVPGGFTYENNAQVVGDELYIRDANGNQIPDRSVSDGDKITVLDVGYTKQLALVQYPAGSCVRQGYVTNATKLIKYFHQDEWHNGTTSEIVYDQNKNQIGSIDPYESATPLYRRRDGMIHVVYNTSKGDNTKSGFVVYDGSYSGASGSNNVTSIPLPALANHVGVQTYGTSGNGRPLKAYRIGIGFNSLVLLCEVHGFEDNWYKDGVELVKIGNKAIEDLANSVPRNWSVYIIPSVNPDGLLDGKSNNGPGRCTIVGEIDINRDFPVGFTHITSSRNHTGQSALSVSEASSLKNYLEQIKSSSLNNKMVVIDLHGWENDAIGDSEIGKHFVKQFGFRQIGYGPDAGYIIQWAHSALGAQAALIELPSNTRSHDDVVKGDYATKVISALKEIMGYSVPAPSQISTMPALTEVEKIENDRYLAYRTGVKGVLKIGYKYYLVTLPNIQVTYKCGLQATKGKGASTLELDNGKMSFKSLSLKPQDTEVFQYVSKALKDEYGISFEREIAKCGKGNLSIEVTNYQLVPYPEFSLSLEFEYKNTTSDGKTRSVFHTIEITISDKTFWPKTFENAVVLCALALVCWEVLPEAAVAVEKIPGTLRTFIHNVRMELKTAGKAQNPNPPFSNIGVAPVY